MDILDDYRIKVEEKMRAEAQIVQERTVLELMRAYALYPQRQKELLRPILYESQPRSIVIGEDTDERSGYTFKVPLCGEEVTREINLAAIAQQLKNEGLLPPHIQASLLLTKPQTLPQVSTGAGVESNIQLNHPSQQKGKQRGAVVTDEKLSIVVLPTEAQIRSLNNTVELFSKADPIIQKFKDLSDKPKYDDNQDKLTAVQKAEEILVNAKTMNDYNAAFNFMAPFINRHKNYSFDIWFGNNNTDTWKEMMKRIREPATQALFHEVGLMENIADKIARLKEAREMPLFKQHRNNHWYTGNVGDTHAVSVIKKEISILEDQRNKSVLAPA